MGTPIRDYHAGKGSGLLCGGHYAGETPSVRINMLEGHL